MASTRLNCCAFFRSGSRKCERFFFVFLDAEAWSLRRYLRALADWAAVRDCWVERLGRRVLEAGRNARVVLKRIDERQEGQYRAGVAMLGIACGWMLWSMKRRGAVRRPLKHFGRELRVRPKFCRDFDFTSTFAATPAYFFRSSHMSCTFHHRLDCFPVPPSHPNSAPV